jgi:hypothetical protein
MVKSEGFQIGPTRFALGLMGLTLLVYGLLYLFDVHADGNTLAERHARNSYYREYIDVSVKCDAQTSRGYLWCLIRGKKSGEIFPYDLASVRCPDGKVPALQVVMGRCFSEPLTALKGPRVTPAEFVEALDRFQKETEHTRDPEIQSARRILSTLQGTLLSGRTEYFFKDVVLPFTHSEIERLEGLKGFDPSSPPLLLPEKIDPAIGT